MEQAESVIPARDIEQELRKTVSILGSIFSNPIDSRHHPTNIARLTLDQIIERTQQAEFAEHHQTYKLDGYLADITKHVITEMLQGLSGKGISAGIRIEHDVEEVGGIVKKKVTVEHGEREFIVHANPIEGTDNFATALSSWAKYRKSRHEVDVNCDSCITLAFADKKDPYNPISAAVYSLRNHQIYGAFRGINDTYVGTMGFETATLLPHRVLNLGKTDLRFFIADYKYDVVDVPSILEEALRLYGKNIGMQVDRIRGTVASAANILKVIIEAEALGYFDYRPTKRLIEAGIKGKFASLKATNVLHTLPVVRSRGFVDRSIRSELLTEAYPFDLSDPHQNPDISLVIVPIDLFEGRHPYKAFEAIHGVSNKIDENIERFIEENQGTGYNIPGYNLTKLISGEGAYKQVWLAYDKETPGKQVVVKIFDSSKSRGRKNLLAAGITTEIMEKNEKNMAAVRDRSIYVAFLYGLRHDGRAPDGSTVSYMIEKPFKETLAQKYNLGQIVPLEEIIKLGSHLIDAVAAGHSLDEPIIHGDVKDENLGIDLDGNGILTDYGISLLLNSKEERKANIGSIHTMAPELYVEGTKPTTKSDVFSIGSVIYRMTTGFHPFSPKMEKPSATGIVRDSYEKATRCEKSRPDYSHIYAQLQLPQELRTIVIKAMQKDPEKRYNDAMEMRKEWGMVIQIHDTYKKIINYVETELNKSSKKDYLEPHLMFTEKWLLILNLNASYSSRMAALMHDIGLLQEDSIEYTGDPSDFEAYVKFKQEHAIRCASAVRKELERLGANAALTSRVEYLVKYHDVPHVNGDLSYKGELQNVVDADSISFFQTNLDTYMSQHNGTEERIKTKVKFMYERMSPLAKELLHEQVFFEKAKPYLPTAQLS